MKCHSVFYNAEWKQSPNWAGLHSSVPFPSPGEASASADANLPLAVSCWLVGSSISKRQAVQGICRTDSSAQALRRDSRRRLQGRYSNYFKLPVYQRAAPSRPRSEDAGDAVRGAASSRLCFYTIQRDKERDGRITPADGETPVCLGSRFTPQSAAPSP